MATVCESALPTGGVGGTKSTRGVSSVPATGRDTSSRGGAGGESAGTGGGARVVLEAAGASTSGVVAGEVLAGGLSAD